jgi:hypothetical protein
MAGDEGLGDQETAVSLDRAPEVLNVKLAGGRFSPRLLPISALPTLKALEELANEAAHSLALEAAGKKRLKRTDLQLALTGTIGEGSVKFDLAIIGLAGLLTLGAPADQADILIARIESAVAGQVSSNSPRVLAKYQKLQETLDPGEVLSLSGPTGKSSTMVVLPREIGFIPAEAGIPEPFSLVGRLKQLGGNTDSIQVETQDHGVVNVPTAFAQRKEVAAKFNSVDDPGRLVVYISGQATSDRLGRVKTIEHMSQLTMIDREFYPAQRMEELRSCVDELEDVDVSDVDLRIQRCMVNLPTLVHGLKHAPGLYLTNEGSIEARWLIEGDVLSVTFGSEVWAYRFRRSSSEMIFDRRVDDDNEKLPGWRVLEAWTQT